METHTHSEEVYAEHEASARRVATRDRFGGIDFPATIIGALVALAVTGIFGAIAGAALGTTIFDGGETLQRADVLPVAIIGGLVLVLAYFSGGWAAGRIARYNGMRNGVFAALWTLLLGVLAAAGVTYFGDRFDVLSRIGVPNWMTTDTAMTGGVIGALAAVALMLLFAALGGKRGETYHERADTFLTRPHVHGV